MTKGAATVVRGTKRTESDKEKWSSEEEQAYLAKLIDLDVRNNAILKSKKWHERIQEVTEALLVDDPEWSHVDITKNLAKFRNLETTYKKYLTKLGSTGEGTAPPPAHLDELQRLFGNSAAVAPRVVLDGASGIIRPVDLVIGTDVGDNEAALESGTADVEDLEDSTAISTRSSSRQSGDKNTFLKHTMEYFAKREEERKAEEERRADQRKEDAEAERKRLEVAERQVQVEERRAQEQSEMERKRMDMEHERMQIEHDRIKLEQDRMMLEREKIKLDQDRIRSDEQWKNAQIQVMLALGRKLAEGQNIQL